MYKIDDIMNMLDCNNNIEIQEKGIDLAKEVKCIKVFIFPKHEGCYKNVWENCAKILSNKSDEIIYPYIRDMLEWIKDDNIPGATIILERLKKMSAPKWISNYIIDDVKIAKARSDYKWLMNLSKLLDSGSIRQNLSIETIDILKKYQHN